MEPDLTSQTAYKNKKSLFYISLVFISFVFISVFSFHSSPLSMYSGRDAAFFQLVGRGMTKGMLPYRDFFDMKGIYFFFIEYFSQLLCYGRIGCYLFEAVNFFIILILIDRIHLIFRPDIKLYIRYLALIPYLWIMAITFEGGNLTEEFSLPFVLICILLCEKYCLNSDAPHPPLYGAVYGFCFGAIGFIRITNTAAICAVVLAIFINLIINKEYLCIVRNGLCFIAGLVIAVLPGLIYCSYNGILYEMLDSVFSFGYTYAAEGKMFNLFFFNPEFIVYLFLALFPVFTVLLFKNCNRFLKLFVFVDFAASVMALSMGNCYPHYFTMLIPNLAVGASVVISNMDSDKMKQCKISTAVLCCLLLCLVPSMFMISKSAVKSLLVKFNFLDYDNSAAEIAENIPESDRDSVYTYEISSSWYLDTGLFPCIKYCDWQNHYIALSEKVKEDLKNTLTESPPRWIVTENSEEAENILPDFLESDLAEHYSLYSRNSGYNLWQLKS